MKLFKWELALFTEPNEVEGAIAGSWLVPGALRTLDTPHICMPRKYSACEPHKLVVNLGSKSKTRQNKKH